MVFMFSCKKENIDNPAKKDTGKLSVSIGLSIEINDVENTLKSTLATENFKVIIYSESGEEILMFDRAVDMPSEIELETGSYYVVAHSDNMLPAAFENPYYYGASEIFTIDKNQNKTITIHCELANCKLTIVYSQNTLDSFTDCIAVVGTVNGSLTFSRDEVRAGYFELEPIAITITLYYATAGGSNTKVLTGNIQAPMPKKHYEVHVDASITDGQMAIEISQDETTEIEIITISEEPQPVEGDIAYGELLITEIMYDPALMSDTYGEWFEIYNNTDENINLENLAILRDGVFVHSVSEALVINPHAYFVLARTDTATAAPDYVYGSSLSLLNTVCELTISNFGTNGSDGAVIATVPYDEGNNFPGAVGASIQLSSLHYNVTDALSGTSWCLSTAVYGKGDLGTPGTANTDCTE